MTNRYFIILDNSDGTARAIEGISVEKIFKYQRKIRHSKGNSPALADNITYTFPKAKIKYVKNKNMFSKIHTDKTIENFYIKKAELSILIKRLSKEKSTKTSEFEKKQHRSAIARLEQIKEIIDKVEIKELTLQISEKKLQKYSRTKKRALLISAVADQVVRDLFYQGYTPLDRIKKTAHFLLSFLDKSSAKYIVGLSNTYAPYYQAQASELPHGIKNFLINCVDPEKKDLTRLVYSDMSAMYASHHSRKYLFLMDVQSHSDVQFIQLSLPGNIPEKYKLEIIDLDDLRDSIKKIESEIN